MKITVFTIVLMFRVLAFADESPISDRVSGCVVLLHGLARTSGSMHVMQKALTESGYRVVNVEYPSRELPIEELAPLAVGEGVDECRASGFETGVNFVTHSLGGILVRYFFGTNSSDVVGRVVMLAPPNQGSNSLPIKGCTWKRRNAERKILRI